MYQLIANIRHLLRDESGNVETGLVMIPVLILFLSVLQLPISSLARIAYSSKLQSDTYLQGFVPTSQSTSPDFNNLAPAGRVLDEPVEFQQIPGGGELVIKSRKVFGPQISPLLITGDQFNLTGISVNENR